MLPKIALSLLVSLLVSGALFAQTTTLADETGNNTSAADSFAGEPNARGPLLLRR